MARKVPFPVVRITLSHRQYLLIALCLITTHVSVDPYRKKRFAAASKMLPWRCAGPSFWTKTCLRSCTGTSRIKILHAGRSSLQRCFQEPLAMGSRML